MKCPVCSHVYPDTLSRCSRCGRVAPEATAEAPARSTLIEFPTSRATQTSLPDWRIELNEKVRAIKARRSMEALVGQAATLRAAEPAPSEIAEVEPLQPEIEDHENPIVRAALNRVRRASENAARVQRQTAANAAVAKAPLIDEPSPVHAPRELVVAPPRIIPVAAPDPAPMHMAPPATNPAQPSLMFDPAELLDGFDEDLNPVESAPVNETASRPEASVDTGAPLSRRFFAGMIDLGILMLVAIPFVATTYAVDTDLRRPAVVGLLGLALLTLTIFYFCSTVMVSGRTVGMMLTRLHIEDLEGRRPNSHRVVLRTLGYLLGAATCGLGFALALVTKSRRGLQDLISGTRVVED